MSINDLGMTIPVATQVLDVTCRNEKSDWSNTMRDRKLQEAVNLDVVSTPAQEMQQPFELVKEIYDHEFARPQSDARIPDFLVLFAIRRTRDALSNRRA